MNLSSTKEPQPVCTTAEAARRLGVSSTTVQVMVERGELNAWRTRGGHRRISVDSVESIQRQRGITGAGQSFAASELCIVVLEDVPDQSHSIASLIRQWRWPLQVVNARDGVDALLMVERRRPDILIIDLALPGLNGLTLLRAIRDHHEFDAIQIVAIASEDSSAAGEEARGIEIPAGVVRYPRPVSPEKLQGFVEANVMRRKLAFLIGSHRSQGARDADSGT